MYQSVIRDPGGNGLIRVQPDVCGQRSAVTNGSILIVPPGTTAFVAINGILSHPYRSGRYEIFTGVDPFFVRLQNILTHGDTGTTVSVFFVSTEKSMFSKLGTGEFPFYEHRFQLTMKALASCSLAISISDPMKVLKKLVGSYRATFSEEDIDPCIEQMILPSVRESLSQEISKLEITEFNSNLSLISRKAAETIASGFMAYGVKLEQFAVTAINIPGSEINRLYALEQEYSKGKIQTDLELDNLQRVWGGDIKNRTLGEMMTGIPARNQANAAMGENNSCGSGKDIAPMVLQMAMLSQLLPTLRESMSEMFNHADASSGNTSREQRKVSVSNAPPPMPKRYKRCPLCNKNTKRHDKVCPYCGYKFTERNE